MTRPLEGDCELKLFKFSDDEGKDTFWHSSAHILGKALEGECGCKLCIGPCTTRGEAEAIVNVGPAKFISANGPNPLVVQPVPFYPGPNTGGIHTGHANSTNGLEGEPPDASAGFVPRNIEMRIRTGCAVPVVATSNANDQPTSQQQQEQTDPSRNSSGGESGVRVVPLRTVVAVPSGVNPSAADSSANSIRVFYPLLARVRQQSAPSASDSRGSQDWQQTYNLESRDDGHVPFPNTGPFVSGANLPANESGFSHVLISTRQSSSSNERSTQTSDDAVRNSGSHDTIHQEDDGASTNNSTSTAQVERENLDSSSSSRHRRDPPESPSPKRMKKNE